MDIQLKGWPAVLVILAFVVCGVGYRKFLHKDLQVDPEIREGIEVAIRAKIYRGLTPDLEKAMEAGDRQAVDQLAKGITQCEVTITDLAMRGSAEECVVRAKYQLKGPDGSEEKTGYFRCSYSMLTGWNCHYEVPIWRWYVELF